MTGTTNARTPSQAATASNSATQTTNKPTSTGSNSQSNGSKTSAEPTPSVSVNPVDPPGGVTMISPAARDSSSTYFKIGTTVTFSWSYTSVQVTPTAVDVEAYCAINKYILAFLKGTK